MSDGELLTALTLAALAGGYPDPVYYALGQMKHLKKELAKL